MADMGKSMPLARAPRDQMRFGFSTLAQVSPLEMLGCCSIFDGKPSLGDLLALKPEFIKWILVGHKFFLDIVCRP